MQPHAAPKLHIQGAFGALPLELFLNCLDQLVGGQDGRTPVAYEPSHEIAKTLRALTLVSRTTYKFASRYLYARCLCLNDATRYTHFRRTLGLNLGLHPLAPEYGRAIRNEELFNEVEAQRHITSLLISPGKSAHCKLIHTPRVRLPQIVDLCTAIGFALKRLAIDLTPVYIPHSELMGIMPPNIFLQMPNLEELICSYETTAYFSVPPPNLKRLAITANEMTSFNLDFYFMQSSLEQLYLIRPKNLTARQIDELFSRYKGRYLDVVFVALNKNHATPGGTRNWTPEDKVGIWEADVPTSFYGDEDDLVLSDSWIWTHGVRGDLWQQKTRRMLDRVAIANILGGLFQF